MSFAGDADDVVCTVVAGDADDVAYTVVACDIMRISLIRCLGD